MHIVIGLAAAAVCIFCWGSLFVPMERLETYDSFSYLGIMGVGIWVSSMIVCLVTRSFSVSFIAFLAGVIWACAETCAFHAIKDAGVATSSPVWSGTSIGVAFAWGSVFLKESITSLPLALGGIILIAIGVTRIAHAHEVPRFASKLGNTYAILAGLLFGSYLMLLKVARLPPFAFLFSMAFGILFVSMLLLVARHQYYLPATRIPAVISGLVWNIANITSFAVVAYLGISIGYPITQMALLVSVLWGIWYFKEITRKADITYIQVSAVILLLGAFLLALAK